MFLIIGIILLAVSVIGGYTMHGGDLQVLVQPSEFIIIIGASVASFLISNNKASLIESLKSLSFMFKSHPYSKKDYLELISLFFSVSKVMKIKGMLEIENHIEHPEESAIFTKSPSVMNNHENISFLCDNLRLLVMGVDNPHEFESMIDEEIEVRGHKLASPGHALNKFADSMPALGIVAAVLGVIVTMGSVVEPPEVLGGLIAAALVGTFLGVLLSYGIFLPIATYISAYGEEQIAYLRCVKIGLVAYLNGNPPAVIVEYMRKAIPVESRPSFQDSEMAITDVTK